MKSQLVCFHGHKLNIREGIANQQPLVCPLCGSISDDRTISKTRDAGAFGATIVPHSMVDPLSSEGLARAASAAEMASSTIETDKTASETPAKPENESNVISEPGDSILATTDMPSCFAEDNDFGTLADEPSDAADRGALPRTKPIRKRKELKPPDLPGYEIMEELGRGGMGVVYQAYDEKHGRDVALKTLQRMTPDDIVRFKQEFRALADIAHRNLVSLYELLSDGKTWCFTMEILQGVEFLDYVWSEFDSMTPESASARQFEVVSDAPRMSFRRINRLYDSLRQMAVGLNELHRIGKLHSDIKPSNVKVTTEGRLVLLDFGLIAEISKGEDGRVPRVIQGTPHYMSPEQATCAPLSGASDWYAVGVMLYEVLTGRLPFRDDKVRMILRKQYERPVEPIVRQALTPPELNELCMALLEINPRNRPSATDVLRAVDAEELARSIEETQPVFAIRSGDLVGRESQFETLNQIYSEVKRGESRSVFVHGLSGMGKSVLIRAFIDSLRSSNETIVLEGRCYEQESVPFKALDDLIDSLVIYLSSLSKADISELLPDDILPLTRLFPVLGQVPGAADESRPSIESIDQLELRQRAKNALRELLTRLGQRQPIVMYIDDLQWGDEDSANLFADLMRPPESPRIMLLGSYRREDAGNSPCLLAMADAYNRGQVRPHRCELPIEPLSVEDATRLATMLLPLSDSGRKRLAERIAQESGGSPFFVWELVQHLQVDPSGEGSLELDEVIWSRVRRLPEETRRLLEVFAVSGRPMRASEAYQVIDEMSQGPRLLAQLRTNSLIRTKEQEGDTIVETYHDRIRESVVNHLANAKVRGYHLKLALVIEQASNISVANVQAHIAGTPDFFEPGEPLKLDKRHWQRIFDLAYFFDAAGKSERAMSYALIAAERAWKQNAFEVAEQQFEIAKRGADSASPAIRFRIAEQLGDVLMMRGRYDKANQQFQTARSLANDNVTFARIDGKRGALCFKQGEMAHSIKHYEQALKALGDPPPSNQVTQVAGLLKESCVQLMHTLMPQWFTRQRPAETEQGRLELFRARLYEGLGYPYWFSRGPIPTLWTHLRQMNLAEHYLSSPELGRAYSLHAVMITAIPLAARGVAYAEKSYQIHGELGDRLGQGKARSFQTFSLFALGRFREGVKSGREAVRLLEQAGDVWECNMAHLILSQPLYFFGQLKESFLEARRAYEIGKETGDYSGIAIALYFLLQAHPSWCPEGELQAECERRREDPLSSAAVIQGRGLELLFREDNPAEAAKVLGQSLDVARQRGLRNPCIFCGVTWKATALRIVAERESGGPSHQSALANAKKGVRDALRITKKYLSMRSRALRECGEIAVLEGREAQARRLFEESSRVAESQEAAYEHAHTLLARGKAGLKFGWPDAQQQIADGTDAIRRMEDFGDL